MHKQGFSVPAQACAVAVLAGAVLLLAAPYLWTGRWNTFALDQSLNDQTGYVTAARSLAERGRLESSVYYAGLLPQVKSHNVIYMPGAYYVRAAFFAIFGFSVFTSTLPNLLAFVASCVLSFLIGARLAGPRAGWISSLFVISYPPFLLYAYSSMTELLLSFLCLLVCWAFLASSPRIQGPLAGALIALPYLVRDSALLLLPGFAVFLALDIRGRRAPRIAGFAIAALIGVWSVGRIPAVADRPQLFPLRLFESYDLYYDATISPGATSGAPALGKAVLQNIAANARLLGEQLTQGPGLAYDSVFLVAAIALILVVTAMACFVEPRHRPFFAFAATCGLAGLVASASIPRYLVGYTGLRHSLFAVPFLFGALAVSLSGASRRLAAGFAVLVLLALLCLANFFFLKFAHGEYAWTNRYAQECAVFLDKLGAGRTRGFIAPAVIALDYVLIRYPVRWSFPPANEHTLALLMEKMPVDLIVLPERSDLVRETRTGTERTELLEGAFRLEEKTAFSMAIMGKGRPRTWTSRFLVYRSRHPREGQDSEGNQAPSL